MSERYYSPRTGPYEQYDDDYPCQICGMKIMSWLNWWKENPPQWGVTTEELEAQLEWCSDIRLLCDPDGEFEQLLPDFELRKMEKGFSTRQERDIQPKLRSRSQAPEIEVYGGEYRAGPIFTRHNSNGSPDLNIYQNYLFRTSDDKAYAAVVWKWPKWSSSSLQLLTSDLSGDYSQLFAGEKVSPSSTAPGGVQDTHA